jgi:hypothetical protein
MFQGRFEDRAFAIEVFGRYNEKVRRDVPPGWLPGYEVREDWEPLSAFLVVPGFRGAYRPGSAPDPRQDRAATRRSCSSR